MTRFVPQNRDAEAAALACAFFDDEAARIIARTPENFFTTEKHRSLQAGIKACVARDQAVDMIFLPKALQEVGKWADSGNGESHLVNRDDLFRFQDLNPVASQIRGYVRLIQQAHRQRRMCEASEKIRDAGSQRFLTEDELADLEDSFQQAAFEISVGDHARRDGPVNLERVMSETFQALADRYEGRKSRFGIKT